MNSLFVYGTLRHVPLLAVVVGRPVDSLDLTAAVLTDHQVYEVLGHDFPFLTAGGTGAPGLLIGGLSDVEIQRLRFYEGGFDYDLTNVSVQVGADQHATQVFMSDSPLWKTGGAWSLQDWVVANGQATEYRATEEMSYFGHRTRAAVDAMLPMIRARATAKHNAQINNRAHSPGGMGRDDVTDVAMTRPYADFFTLEEYDLTFRRYDGTTSEMVRRAVFVASDAVIVLPYDPVRDRVLLIEQFRPGPYARGDAKPWQLEPIAGRVDGAETPEKTAHREAFEEAGLTLARLEEVANCYASPGCSTEYYSIYIGITDLPDDIAGVSGVAEEAEDIRSFLFSFDALMEMTDTMQVVNAPLVLAALWLARHRDALRAGA